MQLDSYKTGRLFQPITLIKRTPKGVDKVKMQRLGKHRRQSMQTQYRIPADMMQRTGELDKGAVREEESI